MKGTTIIGVLVALVLLPAADAHGSDDPLLMFSADGMRQDTAVEMRAETPGFYRMIRTGVRAADDGLQTQAPPNTGTGWATIATGAWPGVHGALNNTFHSNGTPFASFLSGYAPEVMRAETLAQAAERGGKKVAQIEWVGGRGGDIKGPALHFRRSFSGSGVVTNYIARPDSEPRVRGSALQFDHPRGFAGREPYAAAEPRPASGWTNVPASERPAREVRLRVLDGVADKYGLNAYIYDSRRDGRERYDRVLLAATKDGNDRAGVLRQGAWADVKVRLKTGDGLDGKTGAMLVKLERLAPDLSRLRLYHSPVTRAYATWKDWPGEPGFSGDFEDFVAERFGASQAPDYSSAQAGIVSEDTFAQHALYWEKTYRPLIRYVLTTYKPDVAFIGYPAADSLQHKFLGQVTQTLSSGAPNPGFDRAAPGQKRDGRVAARRTLIHRGYRGADATMRLAQRLLDGNPNTIAVSDHGFAPQLAAIDASKVLVDLGLLSKPQTSSCRPAEGETIGKAKACWVGASLQVYLNVAGRDPAGGGFQQIPAGELDATVARLRAAFAGLRDETDWTGDGKPEGWEPVAGLFNKAEAARIPNGGAGGADMAHPTRTGDLVVFSKPPYAFDGATPGAAVVPSVLSGQHGYLPDTRSRPGNANQRAAFIAAGPGFRREAGELPDLSATDVAPTAATLLGVPAPRQSRGRVRYDALRGSVGP